MKQQQAAINDAIRAQAATWFTKRHGGQFSATDALAFEQWQNADPRNRLAYAQCAHLWLMAGPAGAAPGVAKARATARQVAGRRSTVASWRSIAAAAAVVLVGVMVYAVGLEPRFTEYTTAVGEQRLVQLADGSTALLNTQSRLRVSYNERERLVVLQEGEAFFTVAKNPEKPFVVEAGGSRVQALGTAFNVALSPVDIRVAVTEGTVQVSADDLATGGAAKATVLAKLNAGEGVRYTPGQSNSGRFTVNLEQVTAWQSRKIYFDNERLEDAIADYNRYTKQRVVLVDRALADQRISGVFNIGDMESFTFALQHTFHARIVTSANRILVLRHGAATDLPLLPATE